MVRPRMDPVKSSVSFARILAGSSQLFVGPASSLDVETDVCAIFNACNVRRVRSNVNAARTLLRVQLHSRPGLQHQLQHLLVFFL